MTQILGSGWANAQYVASYSGGSTNSSPFSLSGGYYLGGGVPPGGATTVYANGPLSATLTWQGTFPQNEQPVLILRQICVASASTFGASPSASNGLGDPVLTSSTFGLEGAKSGVTANDSEIEHTETIQPAVSTLTRTVNPTRPAASTHPHLGRSARISSGSSLRASQLARRETFSSSDSGSRQP
jgi:hypothetical protein